MDKVKKALRNDVTIIENYSFHQNMLVLKAKKKYYYMFFGNFKQQKIKTIRFGLETALY